MSVQNLKMLEKVQVFVSEIIRKIDEDGIIFYLYDVFNINTIYGFEGEIIAGIFLGGCGGFGAAFGQFSEDCFKHRIKSSYTITSMIITFPLVIISLLICGKIAKYMRYNCNRDSEVVLRIKQGISIVIVGGLSFVSIYYLFYFLFYWLIIMWFYTIFSFILFMVWLIYFLGVY